jgi:hypothetical protein
MPRYLVLAELVDAPPADNDRLAEALRALGLTTSIAGKDGDLYSLPTGSYLFSSELGRAELRDWLKPAIASIHMPFMLFITESAASSWHLPKVQ